MQVRTASFRGGTQPGNERHDNNAHLHLPCRIRLLNSFLNMDNQKKCGTATCTPEQLHTTPSSTGTGTQTINTRHKTGPKHTWKASYGCSTTSWMVQLRTAPFCGWAHNQVTKSTTTSPFAPGMPHTTSQQLPQYGQPEKCVAQKHVLPQQLHTTSSTTGTCTQTYYGVFSGKLR
jgi:hypothetical protein